MMKKIITLLSLLGFSSMAYADGGRVGLGVVGEDPSGLTLKYKLSQRQALDFRLGLDGFGNDFLLVQGNYLVNVVYLAQGNDFSLPLYIGGGATFFFFGGEGALVAARLPIGIDFEFAQAHLDVFIEIAPQLVISPGFTPFIDGAVGVRYFF